MCTFLTGNAYFHNGKCLPSKREMFTFIKEKCLPTTSSFAKPDLFLKCIWLSYYACNRGRIIFDDRYHYFSVVTINRNGVTEAEMEFLDSSLTKD